MTFTATAKGRALAAKCKAIIGQGTRTDPMIGQWAEMPATERQFWLGAVKAGADLAAMRWDAIPVQVREKLREVLRRAAARAVGLGVAA